MNRPLRFAPAEGLDDPRGFLPETEADRHLRTALIAAGAQDAWVRRQADMAEGFVQRAYVATSRPVALPAGHSGTLIPVNRLPRKAGGAIDTDALAALPCPPAAALQKLKPRLSPPDTTWRGPRGDSAPAALSQNPASLDGGPVPALRAGVATLADILQSAAALFPDRGVTLLSRDRDPQFLNYADLDRAARQAAGGLCTLRMQPGAAILCLYQDNEDAQALTAIWAAIYAGLCPVPLLAPRHYAKGDAQTRRLIDAAELLPEAPILAAAASAAAASVVPGRQILDLETLPPAAPIRPAHVDPQTNAALFLTSGSTAKPKVVPQSHHAILSLIAGCAQINQLSEQDVSLNWLPMDHVGSFIMLHMRDTYLGAAQFRAAGTDVLRDPLAWIGWLSEHRVTNGWAPNFAFELVLKARQTAPSQDWDLSALRFLHNGGEAVVRETACAFLEELAPFGINRHAIRPAWGMSETSSGSVFHPEFDPGQTANGPIPVGRPTPGLRIRITDPAAPTQTLREGETGLLQVSGSMVLTEYHQDPEKTRDSFAEPGWFNTGDLGRVANGMLYITGRQKDVIIVNGQNHSPADIETRIGRLSGLLPSCTAVLSMPGTDGGIDRVAVFYAPDAHGPKADLVQSVRRTLTGELGLPVDLIFEIAPDRIPKTSIGKIQKEKLRAWAEDGTLQPVWQAASGQPDMPSLWQSHWRPCPAQPSHPVPQVTLCGPESGRLATNLAALGLEVSHVTANALRGEEIGLVPADILVLTPEIAATPFDAVPLVQGLLRLCRQAPMRVIWLAPGSATGAPDTRPDAAMLGALLRSAEAECKQLSVRVVDPGGSSIDPDHLKAEICDPGYAPEVLWSGATRHVQHLTPITSPVGDGLRLPHGGHFLITGGLGGIGQALCRHLQSGKAAKLTLIGRRSHADLPSEAQVALASLRASGEVAYVACDPSDPASEPALRALRCDGIFHLAGLPSDGAIDTLRPAALSRDARIKITGTERLLALAPAMGAKWVVGFGSVIGTFGGANYAGYAMSNRYLQARALQPQQSVPLVSLNWSMWKGTGLSRHLTDTDMVARKGYDVMTPDRALRALEPALQSGAPSVQIGLDATRLPMAVHVDMPTEPLADAPTQTGQMDPRAQQICALWAEVLQLPQPPGPDDNIFDLGATSLDLPRAQEVLSQALQSDIDVLDFFDHPQIGAFAAHLKAAQSAA